MNRNYSTYQPSRAWAEARETHIAVATAIHAISRKGRNAQQIWETPTYDEWNHVTMAVQEYIAHGDFPVEPDGKYPWGFETITF